ncbi:MAG: DUF2158 domain-containing protein [Alphaproteobacteria bacterium]|nr:DUF2158 domain-containing protein [Alphaproteobacteria bacterium]
MEPQIKPGDVVRLKSGGPEMTISKIDDNKIAYCTWFVNLEGPHTSSFRLHMLSLEPCREF